MAHSIRPSRSFQATADAQHPKTIITKNHRRYQLGTLVAIAFVSLGTIALTIIDVAQTSKLFEKKKEFIYKVQDSVSTAFVMHSLQKERSLTALQFGFQQLNIEKQRLKLRGMRQETDESIAMLGRRDDADDLKVLTGGASSFRDALEEFRRKIDKGETKVFQHLKTYSHWISLLISTHEKYIISENLHDWAHLVYAYQMIVLSKEESGMECALGCLKLTQGKNFSIVNNTWYNEKRILAQNYLELAFFFSSEVEKTSLMLLSNNNNTQVIREIEKKRLMLSSETYNTSWEDAADEWLELMTKYNNLILELQIRQANAIEAKVNEEIHHSTNQLVIRSLLLCFTLFVVPCVIVSLAKVQKRFYDYTLSLFNKVGLEQARTDFLMRENSVHVQGIFYRRYSRLH